MRDRIICDNLRVFDPKASALTLRLMIEAERREGVFAANDPYYTDDCGPRVVDQVRWEMDLNRACYGEIDPVLEDHFLAGPNRRELDDHSWVPDRVYAAQYAHASGYHD